MIAKKLFSFIIIFILLILSGCSDTPINTNGVNVSGKVYDFLDYPVAGMNVKIQNKTTYTSGDGSFSISGVTVPYQVQLTDTTPGNNTNYFFVGINSTDIYLPVNQLVLHEPEVLINVSLPDEIFLPQIEGRVIFTNEGKVISSTSFSKNLPDPVLRINLQGNSSVTGKIIVLSYIKNFAGEILTYENYGESAAMQLTPGTNLNYEFTLSQLSLNPGERIVNGTFISSTTVVGALVISFSDSRLAISDGEVPVFGIVMGNNFSLSLPTGLPIQYTALVHHFGSAGNGYTKEYFSIPENTSNITLSLKNPPVLIEPLANAAGITDSTHFNFEAGDGNGIFYVNFYGPGGDRSYVVTGSTNFMLRDIQGIEYISTNPTSYAWVVEKYGEASSINDFVSSYFNKPGYFRSFSDSRNFTTY